MANLLSWLGNGVKRLENTVNNDVVQPIRRDVLNPIGNLVSQGENTVAAGGAGIGGLIRAGAGAITHNPIAEQNALIQTQQAMNNRLALNRAFLTAQQANQGGTALIRPTLSAAGRIAPYAVGGVGSGIIKPALAFGGANALGTGLQGDLKPKDLAKSFALGAAPVGVGKVIGKGVKAAPPAVRAAQKFDQAQNQIGAVGKNVNKPNVPNVQELAMGRALGMAPKDVARAKADSLAPPLTKIPKQAGTVEKVPFSMKPRPTKNPMTPGPLDGTIKIPQVLPGDAAQAHLNADFVAGHIKKVGSKAEQAVKGLSEKDQNLMKQIQTKGVEKVASKADNPDAFRSAEKALRNYYDTRIAYDHAQGIATPYRKNYLRDLIPPPDSGKTFEAKGGNLTPGYTQAKTVPGATPVLEGLQRDIAGSSFNHGKLTYAQGMEQAFPGQINRGAPTVGKEGVSQQLLTPYGNELFGTKSLAKDINKRAASQAATGALGKYDKVNAVAKYIKLGGGAFHALTESGNFVGQQLTSGKLFREPGSTAKVFKTFFSDKALKAETEKMAQSGALENAQRAGLTWTPEAIKADITVTPHGKLSTYTGIKALHDATFRREIPYMKLKTFEQKTQGLDHNNPQDLAKMRTIARGINAEFGGINRAVEGVSPQNAKRWSRILLASDFTESKITTMKNAISKGGEEGKLAREVVAGKALLFGGLAAGGAILGGELTGKNKNDKIGSLAGKILDPSFNFGSYKVSLPATHPSEFIKPFKSFGNGSTDKFSGLKHYATGRLAAVPSEVNQLVNNQDYRGQKIYGTKSQPISGGKAALNIASTAVPIPGSQGIAAATGQQSVPSAIANVIGLRSYQPTPTKAQQAQTGAGPGITTPEQKKQATTVEKTALENDPNVGNGTYMRQLPNGQYAYYVNGDSSPSYTKDKQTAINAIVESTLKASGDSYTIRGETVYRKGLDGNITTTPKIKFDYQINGATLTAQKNAGDYTGWLQTAQKQLDNIDKQLKDPNVDPLDQLTLQNEADSLNKQIDKYSGYGGAFTKGSSAAGKIASRKAATAGAQASFKTAVSAKAPAKPKGVSVRKLAAPSFKASGVRKLSVSKIPVVANRRKA